MIGQSTKIPHSRAMNELFALLDLLSKPKEYQAKLEELSGLITHYEHLLGAAAMKDRAKTLLAEAESANRLARERVEKADGEAQQLLERAKAESQSLMDAATEAFGEAKAAREDAEAMRAKLTGELAETQARLAERENMLGEKERELAEKEAALVREQQRVAEKLAILKKVSEG